MPGPSVQRTIVKSKPELWSELSDAGSLAKHLDAFGEITITELEPETAVAWEGDRVRGTVTLERSGWGTKVTVTARYLVDEARSASSDGPAEQDREVGAAPEAPADVTEELSGGESVGEAAAAVSPKEPEVAPEPPEAEAVAPGPEAVEPIRRAGFWARMRARWKKPPGRTGGKDRDSEAFRLFSPEVERKAEAVPEVEPTVTLGSASCSELEMPSPPEAIVPELDPEHEIVLTAMLDRLGQAHHRPFSRG